MFSNLDTLLNSLNAETLARQTPAQLAKISENFPTLCVGRSVRENVRKHACDIWNQSVKLELDSSIENKEDIIAEMRRLSVILFQASSSGDSA
jgi:hypothetical protein